MLPSSLYNVDTQALLNITVVYSLKQLVMQRTDKSKACSGVSHVEISDHSFIYAFRKISLPSAVKGSSAVSYIGNLNISIVIGFIRTSWLNRGLISCMGIDNPNEMWLKPFSLGWNGNLCSWKCVMCTFHSALNTPVPQKAHELPLSLNILCIGAGLRLCGQAIQVIGEILRSCVMKWTTLLRVQKCPTPIKPLKLTMESPARHGKLSVRGPAL